MKELKIGKVTSKELASWFGLTYGSYRNKKKTCIKELKDFASFKEVHGGVVIEEIYIPVYEKISKSRAYQIIKENFHNAWHSSGYDTAARVGSQIWRENKELQELIKESTAKHYASKVRSEFYGRVYKQEKGSIGYCKYDFVKRNGWEEAELLTEEQYAAIKELKKEIYVNEQEPYLYESLIKGEITESQYQEAINDWNSEENRAERYNRFTEGLLKITEGIPPNKVTKIIQEIEAQAW